MSDLGWLFAGCAVLIVLVTMFGLDDAHSKIRGLERRVKDLEAAVRGDEGRTSVVEEMFRR